jgi:N-acetylated-alpha-linked acidic dipeptidase
MTRTTSVAAAFLAILPLVGARRAGDPATLPGYSSAASATERGWERQFAAIPDPSRMREAMRRLSARPHHVGSPYDKSNAEWIRDQFVADGLDATIETFDVLFPTPRERLVELVAPTHVTAALREPPVAGDPTSAQTAEQLPSYNAYSIDGDVTAPLVYVNQGVPADYEELARHGVSVRGAIVIARYGGSWRGIKPKVAAEHGAVGCLIYSDPIDDGYGAGEVFPAGPFRPRDGVQRGSVMDMPTYPGDPLTPGIGAVPGAHRLTLAQAQTLTKIPVLPISYADATPLLAALRGPVAPSHWRGALPLTYRIGPGPARVHLRVRSNWDTRTLYDVIARIPGTTAADEWIVRGNHHDAWVNGAQDPIAGQIALLEEARALGALLKSGWKPRRTIIYCAWDGEEPGLLGSTEWAETHAVELKQHAVAYFNTDVNGRGYLSLEGSHVLERFLNGVARDITDPETSQSAWLRQQSAQVRWGASTERADARTRPDLRIGALGSGSDYSVFLQHLGIASADLSYAGEDGEGIYHSIYDDFYWFTHYSDTSFVYGRALAQTVGTAVLRLADAQLIPFDFTDLAETVQGYLTELKTLATTEAEAAIERNRALRDGVYRATSDPREPYVPPDSLALVPHLSFAPLENGADALTRSAAIYDAAVTALATGDTAAYSRPAITAANAILVQSERALTSPEGLPGRSWYTHLLYAPGYYTGYGVKTVPAVREAIEQRQWSAVDGEIARVGAVLQAEATLVSSAAAALTAP